MVYPTSTWCTWYMVSEIGKIKDKALSIHHIRGVFAFIFINPYYLLPIFVTIVIVALSVFFIRFDGQHRTHHINQIRWMHSTYYYLFPVYIDVLECNLYAYSSAADTRGMYLVHVATAIVRLYSIYVYIWRHTTVSSIYHLTHFPLRL